MPSRSGLRIGLVTCRAECFATYFPTLAEPDLVPREPGITPDDQRLVDALRRRGHEVVAVVWDDAAFAAGVHDRQLLIVRSPWDYMDCDSQREQFCAWLTALERLPMPTENHPRVMRWLMDKRYLLDFAAAGVPIVPTTVIDGTQQCDLDERLTLHGPTIVKPAVSAAGAGLVLLTTREQAQHFQSAFDARRRVSAQLLQTFLGEIQTAGEWSLVYLAGQYSHAVHKRPGVGKILVHAEQGGSLRFAEPPATVLQAGQRVVAAIEAAYRSGGGLPLTTHAWPLLYLRVDLIETAQGVLLSECEGVEPELFFRARAGSERLCCEAIEQRYGSGVER